MMSLHERCVGATDEWYTPPYVFDAMGCVFDMDVASPGSHITPWISAKEFITKDSFLPFHKSDPQTKSQKEIASSDTSINQPSCQSQAALQANKGLGFRPCKL